MEVNDDLFKGMKINKRFGRWVLDQLSEESAMVLKELADKNDDNLPKHILSFNLSDIPPCIAELLNAGLVNLDLKKDHEAKLVMNGDEYVAYPYAVEGAITIVMKNRAADKIINLE